jgi:aldose 1-epimerase
MKNLLVKKENFDTVINGKKVELFTLTNNGGITVQLTNYGGHLVSIITPDKDGNYADVILGYNDIQGYVNDVMFLGCAVGPFANRIKKGKFTIDGVEYNLFINWEGGHHLHSCPDGFHKEVYTSRQEGNKVIMTADIPHMKTGFPGNKVVTLIYELLPNDTLRMNYSMTTDKKTLANMTNHAYFNLAGEGTKPVLDNLMQIFADSFTEVDAGLIPTGKLIPVENTPFDFRKPVAIGKMLEKGTDNEQIKFGGGFDHNWLLSKKEGEMGIASRVVDPESKRFLEVHTNQPVMVFYGGNFMDGKTLGKCGKPYNHRSALTMEAQKLPDAPNHRNFHSTILEPGEKYELITEYVFGIEK